MELLTLVNDLVWGKWMCGFILATGALLMLRLKFLPLLKIGAGFKLLFKNKKSGEGDISPFGALMTSLSATIGTGNIAGVATAIAAGGPGALFWMWCSALFGMATKYAEAVCAVKYRETDADGKHVGGPMYYIKNGLGKKWYWLAILFAFFGVAAGFGIGNTVQSNSVAEAMNASFGIEKWVTGIIMMILVGLVLIGGIKRIAQVVTKIVPLMAISYLLCGLVVLLFHFGDIPAAFALVIESAFQPVAAQGGFAGAAVALAIEKGIARGVFSNEAGLGSAPIAHAAAQTNSPVRQGMIAMLGTFIDTLIVCSITGLAIIVTGVWDSGLDSTPLTQAAFSSVLPRGDILVSIAAAIFAFTTILGWSYYGERCAQFLFGEKSELPFRILWVIAVPLGAGLISLDVVWKIADTLNGLMAIPNLIALILLSSVVVKLTREYLAEERALKPVEN